MLKILKQSAKNQELFPWQRSTVLCIYLMAIVFNDSSYFEVLKQYQSFFSFRREEGPIAEK